jgi:Neutral/alkaline non-lysosomal ceramidase, N-terminal
MRFGIANIDITPPFKTTMGGYASRQGLFDKVNDPLACTVIILEEHDRRAVIVAADLIAFNDAHTTALRQQLADITDTVTENVLLNASHTHGGPEPRDKAMYFDKDRDTASSVKYQTWLDKQICKATATAMNDLKTGSLWYGTGKSLIPMNRRLERNGKIVNAPNPAGQVDDRLQLLAIKDQNGKLRALGIRLSCHPVATGAQNIITADFPGAFKATCIEELGSDVVPFFLQGAGGDMRPRAVADGDKWRQMPHCELAKIGQQLFNETLAVLNSDVMEELKSLELDGHFEYAKVACEHSYTTKEDFAKLSRCKINIEQLYAKNALHQLEAGKTIPDNVNIGVQTLWLTKDLAIVGIQGEVLVALGAYVENSIPALKQTILLGYSNGCVCYLPDTKELQRGGYEQMSYLYSGWTGQFKPNIEKTIAAAVYQQNTNQK